MWQYHLGGTQYCDSSQQVVCSPPWASQAWLGTNTQLLWMVNEWMREGKHKRHPFSCFHGAFTVIMMIILKNGNYRITWCFSHKPQAVFKRAESNPMINDEQPRNFFLWCILQLNANRQRCDTQNILWHPQDLHWTLWNISWQTTVLGESLHLLTNPIHTLLTINIFSAG